MKMIFFFIIFIIAFCQSVNAQPYLYYRTQSPDTTVENEVVIRRIDLKTNIDSVFDNTYGQDLSFEQDQTQTFFNLDEGRNSAMYDCNDPYNPVLMEELTNSEYLLNDLGRILYSAKKNYLYFFYEIYDVHKDEDKEILCIYDPISKSEIARVQFPASDGVNKEAFFSSDESIIYFAVDDTNYIPRRSDKDKVYYFSTQTNQITQKKDLSQFGFPSAEGYLLSRGRKGFGIVKSLIWNTTKDSYYRVYNFDKDTGSDFMKVQGYTDSYITDEGKYLILVENKLVERTKINTGKVYIYDVNSAKLVKTLALPQGGVVYTFDNYPDMFYYFMPEERKVYSFDIPAIIPKFNLNINIEGLGLVKKTPDSASYDTFSMVKLQAIANPGYKFAGWSGDVTATTDTISILMTASKNITVKFVPSVPGLGIKLINSSGSLLTGGTLQYYEGSWKDAQSNGDGTFSVNTQLKTVSLRMTYEGTSQTKQNIPVGQLDAVIFQTNNIQVKLLDSNDNLLGQGSVQYYAGQWRDFGTTSNGVAQKELLSGTYSFRMTFAYGSNDKQQDLLSDPIVVFKTVNTQVNLKDSQGNLLNSGKVQYYASVAWRDFGTTSGGVAQRELLPGSYPFRMTYEDVSVDKTQNTAQNSQVDFSTIQCTIKVKNQQGQPVDNAAVSYYSISWKQIGLTQAGQVTKELLPAKLSFRAKSGNAQQDKQQDLSVNSIVEFTF